MQDAIYVQSHFYVRELLTRCGSHFYDRDTVRVFSGRTDARMHGGRFWVESARYGDEPRHYRVAWLEGYGKRYSVERSEEHYATLPAARKVAQAAALAYPRTEATRDGVAEYYAPRGV